jgi:hypothetical protein
MISVNSSIKRLQHRTIGHRKSFKGEIAIYRISKAFNSEINWHVINILNQTKVSS